MENKSVHVNLGVGGITLIWGIVTQCLSWAGVISWPWIAIWGPFLGLIAIELIIFVLCLIVIAFAWLLKEKPWRR